jgi:hypothetical protein
MGPDVISGPGFNYGYAGNSFGVGAGFFNVRPATGATGVNPSLRFMTVDTERMIVTNAGNVGIGTSTPGQKLDVAGNGNVQGSLFLAGNLVLPATASASVGVITVGGTRFAHIFGTNNTFIGSNAGNLTMSGGGGNTAIGTTALQANTTGDFNTASGWQALYNNTSGRFNTTSGIQALYTNTSGSFNTAIGIDALVNNTTGASNTALGSSALYFNEVGSNNIGIGNLAGNQLRGSDNIDIGNTGGAAESSTIRIGTGGTHTKTFIAGISGVTTGAAAVAVLVDANGQLGTTSSSRRFKFDIADMRNATAGLMRLRPVTFRYLAHGDNAPVQYGLIAEEVAEIYPELVTRNKDGDVETVMYQFLAPMLLNEVQNQHRQIEEQQKTNDRLERRLEALEKELALRRN